MNHEMLLPTPVVEDGEVFLQGACSCGWTSATCVTPRDARKASKSHVQSKQNEAKRKRGCGTSGSRELRSGARARP